MSASDPSLTTTSTSYAPRSPDLSAVPQYTPQSPGFPQSAASYYPPPDAFSLHPPSHYHYSTNAAPQIGHPDFTPPSAYAHPQYDPHHFVPPHIKHEQHPTEHKMAAPAEPKPYPGQYENVEIKTKFPVARIKRIVQADEEVGKVAQVTPVVVSKALELFMISLAFSSAEQARARNSKRVTAAHLKLAVSKDDQFDFLSDIAEKIADAPAAAAREPKLKRRSFSAESPDEADEEAAPKRKTRGRKKKAKSDDDDDF